VDAITAPMCAELTVHLNDVRPQFRTGVIARARRRSVRRPSCAASPATVPSMLANKAKKSLTSWASIGGHSTADLRMIVTSPSADSRRSAP